jgi:hypothetical protein
MLQELAARSGASAWAIASMLFFFGAWLVIAVRVVRARPEDMDTQARLVLEGDPPSREALRGTGTAADGHDGPDRDDG